MAQRIIKFFGTVFCIAGTVSIIGCSGAEPSNRELGAGAGAALGAGLGAIVGNQTGSSGAGIAIGAATGAIIGGLLGNESDNMDRATTEQEERLRRQQEELERQRRELEDLKRQEYHDDSYRKRVEPNIGAQIPSRDNLPAQKGDSFRYNSGDSAPIEQPDSGNSNDSFQRY